MRSILAIILFFTASSLHGTVYQNGQPGYQAQADAGISNLNAAAWNGFNGSTTRSSSAGVYKLSTGIAYEMLVRFDGLSLPAGARVSSASLRLNVTSWYSGIRLLGNYVRSPWNVNSSSLGWAKSGDNTLWQAPGAMSDVVPGAGFYTGPLQPSGDQTVTIVLDPDTVNTMIASGSLGLLFAGETAGFPVRVSGGSHLTAAKRPLLTIDFTNSTTIPAVTLNPNTLGFGNQSVGSTGAVRTVTLTNTGTGALSIAGIGVAGANPGDFAQSNACAASLAAGANCAIAVTFRPTAAGARGASLTIADNAPGSPHTIAFNGSGTAGVPAVNLSSNTLTFGNQSVGSTGAVQVVTLTNSGTGALSIVSIGVAGANPGDFAQSNACAASLAPGANCAIAVTFQPTAAGARGASVTIADNASGSPHAIALGGSGVGGLSVIERDANISNLNAGAWNGFNGTTYRSDKANVYQTSAGTKYQMLLRFDGFSVPVGGTVSSASLQLTMTSWYSGIRLLGYYVQSPWDIASPQLGWVKSGATTFWKSPGALADVFPGTGFSTPQLRPAGEQTITIALDPAAVSAALASGGIGLLLTAESPNFPVTVYGGTFADAAKRPRFTIASGAADTTPPTVSITSPAPGTTVTAGFQVSAVASDNDRVAGVQFLLDGQPVGAEVTAPPYALAIPVAGLANGGHTLSARARDAAGNAATAAPVSITVTVVAPPIVSSRFFAPAAPSGEVAVALCPTENVQAGVPVLTTFGMPFTRGSVLPADLSKVRVLKNGGEIPAHVEMLTPWRHLTESLIDSRSVRVARVQIRNSFQSTYPACESVTVQWGIAPRSLDVAVLQNPRTAWHQVVSGSFVAADGVFEPDVYAVLPPAHLAQGVLPVSQTVPFHPSVTPVRVDPGAVLATTSWPGFAQFDTAQKNFFYTIVNQDDPRVAPANFSQYKTAAEPWLFDRSSAMYMVYFRSGVLKALREAVRSSGFYWNNLYKTGRATGMFKLKVPDPNGYLDGNGAMYSYNESLAYTYWLTGDDTMQQSIRDVVTAFDSYSESIRWSSALGVWTERHVGFHLLATVIAFEVFGDAAYKTAIQSAASSLEWHQNGAGGVFPATRLDGGLYHYGRQHGDAAAADIIASPWMSALISNGMTRAYGVTEDPAIALFVRRMGKFIQGATHSDLYQWILPQPLPYTDYLTNLNGTSNARYGDETDHALETSASVGWASLFADILGTPDPTLKQTALSLFNTHMVSVLYFTRPLAPASGLSAFRVQPWRKYAWQYRPSLSVPWLLQ